MDLPESILEENKKTEARIRKTEIDEEIRDLKKGIDRTGSTLSRELQGEGDRTTRTETNQ